jgi:hypothetical protein
MTMGSPVSAAAAKRAIAPVAPSEATWPGPKTELRRTAVARATCARQASSPSRFESAYASGGGSTAARIVDG